MTQSAFSPKTIWLINGSDGLVEMYEAFLSQTVVHFLQSHQVRVFVLMTCLARVGYVGIVQRILGEQRHKNMRVGIPGFTALCDSRHMAPDAVGKRVNGMGQRVIDHLMARQTLLRPGALGLKLSRRNTQLMDIMT